MENKITPAKVDDDVEENDGENEGPLDKESFDKIEVTLGKGEKRVWLTTKPYTFNQLLKMVR
jgi:hypothetical protein